MSDVRFNTGATLAIIPTRGDSKGLPRKCERTINGVPLLVRTVRTAAEAGTVDRVIVSTDDDGFADMAGRSGAEVPFLSPAHLARDNSSVTDAVLHLCRYLEAEDGTLPEFLLLLQPTSLFLAPVDIDESFELFDPDPEAVAAVCPSEVMPDWLRSINADGLLQALGSLHIAQHMARQKMTPVCRSNGAVYWVRISVFMRSHTFLPTRTRAFVMPVKRSLDIDSEDDPSRDHSPNVDTTVTDQLAMSRFDASVFFPETTQPRAEHPTFDDVKGLIFDLEDCLYPERDFVFSGYRAMARQVMQDYHLDVEPRLRQLFDAGRRGDLFSQVLSEHKIDVDEEYLRSLVAIYRNHWPNIKPYLDTEVLAHLKDLGFRLGLLSDGWLDVQRRKLAAVGLEPLFASIVFSDELGGPSFWKPCPEPYTRTLENLDLEPSECVYIGGNPAKYFLAANRLGMRTVRIRRPGGEHEKKQPLTPECDAECMIESLVDLERTLELPADVESNDPVLQFQK